MVLPHAYLLIIKPVIPEVERVIATFSWVFISSEIFYFHFTIYNSINFPYIKMYFLTCLCVTETENITTTTSKNVD